ncbi:MAG: prephenate dehydrogenase [Kiritimatiellae bacterium]|nr:prephenate dehydrogenase [Kiritimatiellia bacterium]
MVIGIIGLGLIGGSFAKDLRGEPWTDRIIGVDNNSDHAKRARELGLVDELVELPQLMSEAEVILLAIPVDGIVALLPSLLDRVSEKQTVIDLGSTKRAVVEAVRGHARRSRYVAAHPMAGTENSGPDAALSGLFKGKVVLLCNLEDSAPDACRMALQIFHSVGLRFEFMPAEQHDRHAAYVSHLSHVVSYALSLAVQTEEKAGYAVPRLAGGGFASTVRLAKSQPEMWVPIFLLNADEVLPAIDSFLMEMHRFRDALAAQDPAGIRNLIATANQIRELLK